MTVATALWAVMLLESGLCHMGVLIPLLFPQAILNLFLKIIFHSFPNWKNGVYPIVTDDISRFLCPQEYTVIFDVSKPATKPSLLLKMRQQLIFLENESYTSCSMAKQNKTKKKLKLNPERLKLRSDA